MNLRIAVVGSGAIGSYYGTKLACSGGDVHFLMRGDLSEIRRAGLCIQGSGENFHLAEVNCYNSTKEIGPCDLILISVKATSNLDLIELVPPLLVVYALLKFLGETVHEKKSAAKIASHSS